MLRADFRPGLIALLGLIAFGAHAATPRYEFVPAGIEGAIERARKTESLEERIRIFEETAKRVKKDVDALPELVPDAELPRAQGLFELQGFLGDIDVAKLRNAECAKYPGFIRFWADPQSASVEELGGTARFAIDLVKSVCRL